MSNPLDVDPTAPFCASGSRPFRTEDEARAALRSTRAGRAAGGPGSRAGLVENAVKKCKACGWWHLASETGTGRARHGRKQGRSRSGGRRR